MYRKALGKGLSALIPEKIVPHQIVQQIAVKEIKLNPYQPRTLIKKEKLKELADSIREKGVIQPIVLRKVENGYELIIGERRFRAVKLIGYESIPAIVRDVSESEVLELALIENIQREDLNPIEEAKAYKSLIKDFNLNHSQIAKKVGKDRSTITNRLRLLNLPQDIKNYLLEGRITEGHARVLLMIKDKDRQFKLCRSILSRGLSVRSVEKSVEKRGSKTKVSDPFLQSIEDAMRNKFGTKVSVVKGRKKGRIEIEFYSDNDLNRIIELLGVKI